MDVPSVQPTGQALVAYGTRFLQARGFSREDAKELFIKALSDKSLLNRGIDARIFDYIDSVLADIVDPPESGIARHFRELSSPLRRQV